MELVKGCGSLKKNVGVWREDCGFEEGRWGFLKNVGTWGRLEGLGKNVRAWGRTWGLERGV